MSQAETPEISVNDVYKLAHDIAEEFDSLVQHNGIDVMRSLVEKVISILEMLESSIRKIEQLKMELGDMQSYNLHISSLKTRDDHEKAKLKQTFEEAEDTWMQEIITLKTQLSSLKAENERLKSSLSLNIESSLKSDEPSERVFEEQETILHKLRHSLKQKEKHLVESAFNISALNCRIEELLEMNRILHIRNEEAKKDIVELVMEKNENKSELILLKKENVLITENLCELVQCNLSKQKDTRMDYESHSCDEMLRADIAHHIQSEMRLLEKIKKLQTELQFERGLTQRYEQKFSKLSDIKNEQTFPRSKIHQFFHLFLGVN